MTDNEYDNLVIGKIGGGGEGGILKVKSQSAKICHKYQCGGGVFWN